MKTRPPLVFGLVFAIAPVLVSAQQHPSFERGFDPAKLYQFGDIDNVNLLNGNLVLTIPIGPSYPVGSALSYRLQLVYNSKVWDHDERQTCGVYPRPAYRSNAGVGWSLSLGTLLDPSDPTHARADWLYVGPDGGEHIFYPSLHDPPPNPWPPSSGDGCPATCYTRDGSYIRMTTIGSTRKLEFPDGTEHTFTNLAPTGSPDWRLTSINDKFPDVAQDIQVTYPGYPNDTTMEIHDKFGRAQRIVFTSDLTNWYKKLVQRVELTTFSGTTATYTFAYLPQQLVDIPPEKGICNGWLSTQVPLLTGVSLPDGSSWGMATNIADTPGILDSGAINTLWLPTGGRIAYTYGQRELPVGECSGRRYQSLSGAVAARTLYDADGTNKGAWSYSAQLSSSPIGWCDLKSYPLPQEELQVMVTSPLLDKTVHYFSVFPGWSISNYPGTFLPEDYGLPFSRLPATDGATPPRLLSTEVYDCDATGTCPTTPVREAFVRYERDPDGGTIPACGWGGINFGPDCMNTNRRPASERTLYLDDPVAGATPPYRSSAVDSSDFDGFGHYRTTVTSSNFGAGDSRTTFTNYNPGNQLQSPGGYWVLNVFPDSSVTEAGQTAKSQFCFDVTTGFLRAKRTLKGDLPGNNDLLAVFSSYDNANYTGNVTSEQYFGGDTQIAAMPTDFCTPALGFQPPWQPLAGHQFRIDHEYASGALKRSWYVKPDGTPMSFNLVDRDINLNTGLVAASRDSAGIATSFDYDAQGRVTWEKPAAGHGAWTEYQYSIFSGVNPARVDVLHRPNLSLSGVLAQEKYFFDGFGRLNKEQRWNADSTWSERLTVYNALGWKTSVSEWQPAGAAGNVTAYSGFDPFGRPTAITPPDGAAHNITFAYTGVSKVDRATWIGTSRSAGAVVESSSTTTERYDGQGRLWQVTEPSDPAGGPVTTTYGYDVGGRLSSVSTPWAGVTQSRLFTYDKVGLLRFEDLPEKTIPAGRSGECALHAVCYSGYDARGHLGRKIDGDNDLSFAYDRAERLLNVQETPSARFIKEFVYADTNGVGDYAAGKLKTATRHNYYDLTSDVSVVETFTYGGVGGRASQKDTQIVRSGITGYPKTFTQTFAWNDLGQLSSETYPQAVGVGPTRTIAYAYTNGYLTGVPGYASGITYHPNGLVSQVAHTNGIVDQITNDPNAMARPQRIQTLDGLTPLWDSGAYAFDGAGNIKAMGSDTFIYDHVNRLKDAALTVDGVGKSQTFSFDAFGNLGQIMTTVPGGSDTRTIQVSPATNRLLAPEQVAPVNGANAARYDAAGNITEWRRDTGNLTTYAWYPLGDMRTMTVAGGRSTIYAYDTDGERIAAYDNGLFSAQDGITYSLRGLGNKVRRDYIESNGAWMWSKDYVYRGEQLLATVSRDPDQITRHFHLDHLGTPRAITSAVRALTSKHTYYPFGEEATNPLQEGAQQVNQRMRFTGHERDLGDRTNLMDDLDYMHARYYSSAMGRFLSVDVGESNELSPQSWNRYAYLRGDPLTAVDVDGRNLFRTLIKVAEVSGHEVVRIIRVEGKGKTLVRDLKATTRPMLESAERSGNRVVWEVKNRQTAEKVREAVSSGGALRGAELSKGYPAHVHPAGEFEKVHVQWREGANGTGGALGVGAWLSNSVLGDLFAPNSQAAAQDPSASRSEIVSAGLWDVASAVDPFFVTDLFDMVFGLNEYRDPKMREPHDNGQNMVTRAGPSP